MRIKHNLLLLVSILTFAACEDLNEAQIQGSANIVSEVRETEAFENIHIASVINATISQGERFVSVEANDNIIDLVQTLILNNTLYVKLEDGDYGDITINVEIAVPDLKLLSSVGVNNIGINPFEGMEGLELDIQGVGNISLDGSSEVLLINSSGASNLQAFNFSAKDCEINLSGVGNVEITAIETLTGALSGVGNILYKGQPEIGVDVTGVGNVVDSN